MHRVAHGWRQRATRGGRRPVQGNLAAGIERRSADETAGVKIRLVRAGTAVDEVGASGNSAFDIIAYAANPVGVAVSTLRSRIQQRTRCTRGNQAEVTGPGAGTGSRRAIELEALGTPGGTEGHRCAAARRGRTQAGWRREGCRIRQAEAAGKRQRITLAIGVRAAAARYGRGLDANRVGAGGWRGQAHLFNRVADIRAATGDGNARCKHIAAIERGTRADDLEIKIVDQGQRRATGSLGIVPGQRGTQFLASLHVVDRVFMDICSL